MQGITLWIGLTISSLASPLIQPVYSTGSRWTLLKPYSSNLALKNSAAWRSPLVPPKREPKSSHKTIRLSMASELV